MTKHTPEAQAAYPQDEPFEFLSDAMIDKLRTAFDRGRASMVETVTTVEELDALPWQTIIRDMQGFVLARNNNRHFVWSGIHGVTTDWRSEAINLPATVLFRPSSEETDRG